VKEVRKACLLAEVDTISEKNLDGKFHPPMDITNLYPSPLMVPKAALSEGSTKHMS